MGGNSLVSGQLWLAVPKWAILWNLQHRQMLSKKKNHYVSSKTPKSSPMCGESQSPRSLSHHFVGDLCPKVRHHLALCWLSAIAFQTLVQQLKLLLLFI